MILNTACYGPISWCLAMLLLLLFVLWLATVVARAWTHLRMRRQSRHFGIAVGPLLKSGQWAEVVSLSASKTMRLSPAARTLAAGLKVWLAQRNAGTDLVLTWHVTHACMRQQADEQLAMARRGLRTLIVVGGTAPIVGFLAAIFGLFDALRAVTIIGSSVLPGAGENIMDTLPLPAFGLLIGLLALWAGAWLARSAEKQRLEIGRTVTSVLDQLARQKPTNGNA